MRELWQRREFRRLLLLIDHLPRDSEFSEAIAQDDDLVADDVPRKPRRPRISEWSPLVDVMARTSDQMAILNRNFVIANSKPGKAPPEIQFYPRPYTAVDRRREKATDFGFEFLKQRTEERQLREAELASSLQVTE